MLGFRVYAFLWYAAVIVGVLGAIGLVLGFDPLGAVALTVGVGSLVAFAVTDAWQVTKARAARPVGGAVTIVVGTVLCIVGLVVGSGALGADIPISARVVALAAGAQALLVGIDVRISGASRTERTAVPFAGHLSVLFGSVLVLESGLFFPRAAVIAYATGFSALAIHVFWMRQRADGVAPPRPNTVPRHWEGVLLTTIAIGVPTTILAAFTVVSDPLVATSSAVARMIAVGSAVIAGVAAVVVLAMLANPPASPGVLNRLSGVVQTGVQHAVVTVVLLNSLLLAVLLTVRDGVPYLLGFYLGLLVVGVTLEYAMVWHAWRRRDEYAEARLNEGDGSTSPDDDTVPEKATEGGAPPVTVVVSAANEGDVLPDSLEHNMSVMNEAPFLLVPAAKSSDDTVAVMESYRDRYPDRTRVVPGESGSKGGDLNAVWNLIETPYVLLLDADETVEPGFLERGLATLRDRPDVGIVQGRKAAAHPEVDSLSRFVSAERQHSTWVEHPFMADAFGAGHFAGSAAIFRHEVPLAVGGWSPERLTEDIDLTIRLAIETDWRVEYDPNLVIRELNPTDVPSLIKQRVRWARGWAQVTAHHGDDLLGSWRSVGARRTAGIGWLLFSSVSAPAFTVFPALLLLAVVGQGVTLPALLAVALAVFLLPARAISIGYATVRDPVIEFPGGIRRRAEVLAHAYLWIPVGWGVQLHALYLQLAGAPGIWHVTKKRGRRPAETAPPAARTSQLPSTNGSSSTNGMVGHDGSEPTSTVFEVYEDRAGEHRWRLRRRDRRILADSGEGYASRYNVRRAIRRLRKHAASAPVVGVGSLPGRNGDAGTDEDGVATGAPDDDGVNGATADAEAVFEVYEDRAGEYRWRLEHRNGNILADSTRGYGRRRDAVDAVGLVASDAPQAPTLVVDGSTEESDGDKPARGSTV